MPAGRPQKADPGALYAFASLFYWDLKRITEGYTRPRVDKSKYKRICDQVNKLDLRLTSEQLADLEKKALEAIQNGRLKESDKLEWMKCGEESWLSAIREDFRHCAAEEATKLLRVVGEPEIIRELLEAETADRVRDICEDAFVKVNCKVAPEAFKELTLPNWPIPAGSTLPSYLSQYASEFIAARKDSRFPGSSDRPSSHLKQLWFLSRALAGAAYGVRARTAINLVGSMRPDEVFENTHGAKPKRRRSKINARRAERQKQE